MHLSEGVLHLPVLAGAGVVAAAGVAIGIRQLDTSRLSLAALFGAAFFVAGTIHVPIGVSSVHLILNGLAGLFLGWAVFQGIPDCPRAAGAVFLLRRLCGSRG